MATTTDELPSAKQSKATLIRASIVKAINEGILTQKEIADRFQVTERTVQNFTKKLAEGINPIPDGRFNNPGRPPGVTEEIIGFSLAFLRQFPKARVPSIVQHMEGRRAEFASPIPTERQLRYALNGNLKEITQAIRKGHHEHMMEDAIVVRRSHLIVNELWQIDCTELDLWCLDVMDGYTLFRPWLVTVIDGCSRATLAACVFRKAPNADNILLTLRMAILPKGNATRPFYGIPGMVSVDNAKYFLTPDVERSLNALGTTLDAIPRECAMEHGIIERWFGTMSLGLLTTLKGYTAQHDGLRKAKRDGAIPFPILQRIIDKWIGDYHLREHSTLGCSPYERWHESLGSAVGLAVNRQTVMDAFKRQEEVTVQRDGILTEDGRHLNSKVLAHYVGKKVTLLKPLLIGEGQIIAFDGKKRLGVVMPVEGNDPLAVGITQERIRSHKEITDLKKRLSKGLKNIPPILTETMLPVDPSKKSPPSKRGNRSSGAPVSGIPDLPKETA